MSDNDTKEQNITELLECIRIKLSFNIKKQYHGKFCELKVLQRNPFFFPLCLLEL